MLSTFRPSDRSGFTLMEVIIAVAVVAIMAGALTPLVIRHLDSAKLARAQNETETIGSAVLQLYKDTGYWPITSAAGPSGTLGRLLSSTNEASGAGSGAQSGASNWSTEGTEKQMGDFLYWNNPDNDSSETGTGRDEANQGYATTGPLAWKGPYLPTYTMSDPWGHAYVMNVRYLPGGIYDGTVRHKVLVLSAGPNGKWETGYSDSVTEEVSGDDIGTVVYISR
jgi:prepilin-type N-terminal cleavage/methylation domain-containing protein